MAAKKSVKKVATKTKKKLTKKKARKTTVANKKAKKQSALLLNDPLAFMSNEVTAPVAEITPEEVVLASDEKTTETDQSTLDDGNIILTGPLTIATTEEWLTKIVDCVNAANEIKIDASEVAQVDGSGLQLLCSLIKTAESKQINVTWTGNNESLQEAAKQAGLDKAIGF